MRTLISSRKRKELMRLVLRDPEKSLGVREAARECGVSPASASIFFAELEKDGVLRKGRLNLENPEVRALRILFNVERVAPAFGALKKRFGIKGMGIYGSWAEGTNTPASDLDVWVLMEKEPGAEKQAELRGALRKAVGGVELSLIFLTKGKLGELGKKDSVFYSTLFHSYLIGGEGIA